MRRRDFIALASGLCGYASCGFPSPRAAMSLPASATWPAVALWRSGLVPASGLSHYGGRPAVPKEFVWPRHRERPLDFVLQVDLSELAGFRTGLDLPTTGTLLFFYDCERQPWGFDPADAGGARVVLVPEGEASDAVATKGPSPFPLTPFRFRQIETVPNPWSYLVDELRPTADERHELDRLQEWKSHSGAQIGGHPDPIQGGRMEFECDLASSGTGVSREEFESVPEIEQIRRAKQWRLLLQVPSDEDLGMMWGDAGMIYFWIREADLAKRDFSRVWVILQCY